MTRLGLTDATTMRGRRIRKEHAEQRGKRGFACYMLQSNRISSRKQALSYRWSVRMFVIAYSGTDANSGERCFKYVAGRLSLKTIHFRACEDLHTVQEFQTLPSLLLIGLKKNLHAVSHGRTHVTNFKILEYQNIIHLLFLNIFVNFSYNLNK